MKDTPETIYNTIQVNDIKVHLADSSKVPLCIFTDQTHLRTENHAIHLIIWSFYVFIKNVSVSISPLFEGGYGPVTL